MTILTLLLSAILPGGMVFYIFGFAPILFAQLPMDKVRPLLRRTFPYNYLAVIGLSVVIQLSQIGLAGWAVVLVA